MTAESDLSGGCSVPSPHTPSPALFTAPLPPCSGPPILVHQPLNTLFSLTLPEARPHGPRVPEAPGAELWVSDTLHIPHPRPAPPAPSPPHLCWGLLPTPAAGRPPRAPRLDGAGTPPSRPTPVPSSPSASCPPPQGLASKPATAPSLGHRQQRRDRGKATGKPLSTHPAKGVPALSLTQTKRPLQGHRSPPDSKAP